MPPLLFTRAETLSKQQAPASPQRARLTNFLIAKSIVEALLVGALAVGFYLTTFNPFFRGALDEATPEHVYGWALDESEPARHVEIQLYIDGRFVATTTAELARPDVLAAGRALDELHGFSFQTPALNAGEHEVRVYAVYASHQETLRTLHQIGYARKFVVQSTQSETAPATSASGGQRP